MEYQYRLQIRNQLFVFNSPFEDQANLLLILYDLSNFSSHLVVMDTAPPFDPAALGLKEIGNLASWTVSSSKPGCGVVALRDDDTNLFWQ